MVSNGGNLNLRQNKSFTNYLYQFYIQNIILRNFKRVQIHICLTWQDYYEIKILKIDLINSKNYRNYHVYKM